MDLQIAEYIKFITLAIVPFMLAITVHEFAHGLSAICLGGTIQPKEQGG